MFRPKYSDQDIVNGIVAGGIRKEKMVKHIHESFFSFAFKAMGRYHLPQEEIKDIYTDAIISLMHILEQGDYKGNSKLSTYFYSIFNHKCVDRIRQISTNKHKQQLNLWHELLDIHTSSKNFLNDLLTNEKMETLNNLLNQIGEKCKQLLLDLDYQGFTPEEMLERMGFKNVGSVKSQKYKCKQKLRALIEKTDIIVE